MKVVLFGATGMIGSAVLKECLDDPRVTSVLVVGRGPCGIAHDKIHEIIHVNFFSYSDIGEELSRTDVCFFCLGVSAARLDEERYHRLTYELTVAAAEALLGVKPESTFCYVSGAGTDSTEKGRMMWARVKGKTENKLLSMGFRAAYMFRPGYVQPVKGVRSKTRLYQAFYTVLGPAYPIMKRLMPNQLLTSEDLARAMIEAAGGGAPRSVLEPADISELAARNRRGSST